ncbi:MAG: hypothetical protein ACXABY_03565 [Candidatus Thorarchaeota archaeon]|jgi:hypothetical protein
MSIPKNNIKEVTVTVARNSGTPHTYKMEFGESKGKKPEYVIMTPTTDNPEIAAFGKLYLKPEYKK